MTQYAVRPTLIAVCSTNTLKYMCVITRPIGLGALKNNMTREGTPSEIFQKFFNQVQETMSQTKACHFSFSYWEKKSKTWLFTFATIFS